MLEELETYKIPALRQAKARLAKDLSIILFSKSGFGRRLVKAAEDRHDLSLVAVDQVVGDLIGTWQRVVRIRAASTRIRLSARIVPRRYSSLPSHDVRAGPTDPLELPTLQLVRLGERAGVSRADQRRTRR